MRMTRTAKYHNVRTQYDGQWFDSKKELERYRELKRMELEGKVHDLQTQVSYTLVPKTDKTRAIKYVADFVYFENGWRVVEDCKSEITRKNPVYSIKKKMMYALLGIEIKES